MNRLDKASEIAELLLDGHLDFSIKLLSHIEEKKAAFNRDRLYTTKHLKSFSSDSSG